MKMARDENHYHEAVLCNMLPEIQRKIAPLEILTHIRDSISLADYQRIKQKCVNSGNIDGARELVDVLLRLYPDAFIKFVEAVRETGVKPLARKIYKRVPVRYKKNLDYIFEENIPNSPPTCHIPGNHGNHRGSQQDLDDVAEEQGSSEVNQLSQQGSGARNSAAGFQSGSPLRHSASCIDNTQCPLFPSNPSPAQNSSVDIVENARGDNYHQSRRSQSTPQINLNVVPPPTEPFQGHSQSVPVTPSKNESLTDNTAVGTRMLSDVRQGEVKKLREILEKDGDWEELIPDDTTAGDVGRMKGKKHPFQELFNDLVGAEWTLEMFMEHAENTLDPQLYDDVCRILRWNPPLLGAVGGVEEEPKILNEPTFYLAEHSGDEFPAEPVGRPTSGHPLETSPNFQQVSSGQPSTHPPQTPDRTINIVQPRHRPNNTSSGEGMVSGSCCDLGSRASGERSAGAVVGSPSQRQSNQQESSDIHRAVGSCPELGSYADQSLPGESQGSVLGGVQTQSDPDGQQAEKSPGMDADQFSEDISAQRPASEYSQLSSAGLSIDGSVSYVRKEKASVQPESDTEGHQAEKGPGLEAERFREDISAFRESTSCQEDEEGLSSARPPQTPDRTINTVQSRYQPNNTRLGRGMLSGSHSELGSRGSADSRSAGSVVGSPSKGQSCQRESSDIHRAVGGSPELGSHADQSLHSESQGSVLGGVQTQSDPDGQQAEKSPGMDADQFREDISAQRPASEYSQLSSAGLSIDGSMSSVSVQPESDTEGHQAEKGPGLEAERLREDISASHESTSRQAESVLVPSVEHEEGFRAEKNSDLEVLRPEADQRAADFRNIQEETDSTQSIGQRSATGHRGTRSSTAMTTTGSAITTALHHPPSDAQTSTIAGCEVTTVSSLPSTDILSSTAASCEAALNLQTAGIRSSTNGTTKPEHIHSDEASLGIGEHQPPLETQISQADSLSSALPSVNESQDSRSIVGGGVPFVCRQNIGLFDSEPVITSEEEGINQSVIGETRIPRAYSGDDEDSGNSDGANADNRYRGGTDCDNGEVIDDHHESSDDSVDDTHVG